jgi:hypothetical protein
MRIAIIGWGSLIWDPRGLEINNNIGEKGWKNDGPELPIEFAKISKDGRLTLVITEGVEFVKTYYAESNFEYLDRAILNLADRERTNKSNIGFYDKTNNSSSGSNEFNIKNIKTWIRDKDYDAVIWTALESNWKDKRGEEFSNDDAIEYLKDTLILTNVKVKEYIENAPLQINTKLRKIIERELGWVCKATY